MWAQPKDYGDVPIEQLEMVYYDQDSSASAVVLFDDGETLVDYVNGEFSVVFKRHVRIKILTDDGLDEGDISIGFRKGKPKQDVKNIKATSYNLGADKKVSKSSIGRRDRNIEKVSDNWSEVKFNVPNLSKVSVFEYSYEVHSSSPFDFPDWFFQRDIPTVWSEYTTSIPEWFTYLIVTRGYHKYKFYDQNWYNDTILLGKGANSSTFDYRGIEYDMAMEDIPAIDGEPFMKASSDYLAHIRFELSGIRMPNSEVQYFIESWDDLVENLLDDEDFGKRLSESSKVDEMIQGLALTDSSSFEDMLEIYNHVSSTIEWDERLGLYSFEKLDKVLKEKAGNGTAINLLLVKALREAGFEAHPLVISTRNNGEIIEMLPMASQFNHTLVYVEVGDQAHILDAKNEKRPFDILPPSVLNGNGLLIYKNQLFWIPVESRSKNAVTKMVTIQLSEDGFQGEINSNFNGIYAISARDEFQEADSVAPVLREEIRLPEDAEIELISMADKFNEGSYEYKAKFKANWETGNPSILYFNPALTERLDKNPFKIIDRSYPVDFDYPFDKNIIINIEVPEGWIVDEMPESLLHRLPERAGEFRRIIQQRDNKITVNYRLRVNKIRFMPEEYTLIKDMYAKMVESLNENIVLKKAS